MVMVVFLSGGGIPASSRGSYLFGGRNARFTELRKGEKSGKGEEREKSEKKGFQLPLEPSL
jgi:hypothetical protein